MKKIKFTHLFTLLILILLGITALLLTLDMTAKDLPKNPPVSPEEITTLLNDTTILQQGFEQYNLRCSRCHNQNLEGGRTAPNLIDNEWIYGGSFNEIYTVIRHGVSSKGMPQFGHSLFDKDIKALTAFIMDQNKSKQ